MVAVADIRFSNVDKKSYASEKPIRLCNYMNVYNKEYVRRDADFMRATASEAEIARFAVRAGDVIITKDSETPDDIGVPAVVLETTDDLVCGYHLALIRPRSDRVDPVFLAKQLAHHRISRYYARLANGLTRYGLTNAVVENTPVWLPEQDEQRLVAIILRGIDEAIAKTDTLIAKLKSVKQGLLHDLLTRGLDDNGELRDPVRHPEQFMSTPLGKRFKDWTLQRLGQMCDLLNGLAFKPTDWTTTGLPIIRIQNLNRGEGFNYYDGVVADKYYIDPGTLLFSWSGNRGTSFGPFIWPGPRGILNQHIFKVTPKTGVRKLWFYYALDDVRQRVERMAHGGSGLVHIRRPDLCEYLVATPREDEQERIEKAISTHDESIAAEEAYLRKLKFIKKGLMQDLLTGRVRVAGGKR